MCPDFNEKHEYIFDDHGCVDIMLRGIIDHHHEFDNIQNVMQNDLDQFAAVVNYADMERLYSKIKFANNMFAMRNASPNIMMLQDELQRLGDMILDTGKLDKLKPKCNDREEVLSQLDSKIYVDSFYP